MELLLLQQLVNQGLVPLVKKEALVPLGVGPHPRLAGRAAGGRPRPPSPRPAIVFRIES